MIIIFAFVGGCPLNLGKLAKVQLWLYVGPTIDNVSEMIQSNPTVKEEVPKISADVIEMNRQMGDAKVGEPAVAGTNGTTGAGSLGVNSPYGTGYGSGYGSSYGGGYGRSYGGYGGSYGGYGRMGMGMGMGMGGMYGMGGMGYGMMGGQNQQPGFLFNTMMTLQSFTYLINCLCEIARSLDQNY